MIPLRVHNILDYVFGFALILGPWLFNFNDVLVATNLFMIMGAVLIVYSLFTKYDYSIAPVIPLGVHMSLDAAAGLTLILAPTFLGYRGFLTNSQEMIHYILGLGAIGLVLFTHPRTEQERELEAMGNRRIPLHHA